MAHAPNVVMNEQAAAHVAAESGNVVRLRALSMQERSRLIESACEAAAVIYRSRLAAGLPGIELAPGRPQPGSFSGSRLPVSEASSPRTPLRWPGDWRSNSGRVAKSMPWAARSPWAIGVSPAARLTST